MKQQPSANRGSASAKRFAGLRVLVIDDESMVTMLIEETLTDLGCAVPETASRLEDALEKAERLELDLAILDVNLHGRQTFPVAEVLLKRGIPVVFATGYGAAALPREFDGVPLLPKPFQQSDMELVLSRALSGPGQRP